MNYLIMEAKKMAKKLVEKFSKLEIDDFQRNEMGLYMSWDDCKKCAMIVVENHLLFEPNSKYWKFVQEEINAL